MKKRIAAAVTVVAVFVTAIAFASIAQAFPNKTGQCSGCHSTDPAVVVTATQTSTNGSTATYSVSVSDAYGDGTTGWAVFDGTSNIANGYGPGTFSVAVGKTYKVFGVAGVGGQGSNSITVSPTAPVTDTTPPAVSITSPAAGATVSGQVTIAATASDASGIARVEFSVDGKALPTDTTAPYSAVWDASTASVGSHTITATAFDTVGNSAVANRAVTVAAPADTTPPSVSITTPANGATVSGSVTIAATATDAGGVATVQFSVDGVLLATDSSSPYSATWNAGAAAPGSHVVEAKAVDAAGNFATATVSVTIAPPADTTAPTVGIISPTNGTTVSGSVAIAVSASDASGISGVEFFVDGTSIGSDTSAPYTYVWDTTGAASGSHTIQVTATDTAKNTASASVSVSIASPPPPPVVDSTPPAVVITAPAIASTVSGSVAIAATASDASGIDRVEFYVDGLLLGADATSPYTFLWDTTGVASGAHTIEVKAFDTVGNFATASTTVSVAAPPPPVLTSVVTVSVGTSTPTGPTSATGGAKVVLRNSATGLRYTGTTDQAGSVTFSGLPYGTYSLTVSARGYKRTTTKMVVAAPTASLSVILSAR